MTGLLRARNIGELFSFIFAHEENRIQAADLHAALTGRTFVSPALLHAEDHAGCLAMYSDKTDLIIVNDFTSLIGRKEEVPFSSVLKMWNTALEIQNQLDPVAADPIPLFTVADLPEKMKKRTFSFNVSCFGEDGSGSCGTFDIETRPLNLNPVQKLPYLKTCLALQAYNSFRLQLSEIVQETDSRRETQERIAALIEEDSWPHVFLSRHRDKALEIIMNQLDVQIAEYEMCDLMTRYCLAFGVGRHLQRRYAKRNSRIREFRKLFPSADSTLVRHAVEESGWEDNTDVYL